MCNSIGIARKVNGMQTESFCAGNIDRAVIDKHRFPWVDMKSIAKCLIDSGIGLHFPDLIG